MHRPNNSTEADNAENIDVAMSMYNLIEYINNYSKTTGNLWQYYRDELVLNNAGGVIDFPDVDNISTVLKFKQKITGRTGNHWTNHIQMIVSLKYLSNFWTTLKTSLINCKINLVITWFANSLTVTYQHLQ